MVTNETLPVMYGNDCGFGGGNIIWAFLLFALLGGNGFAGRGNGYGYTNELWESQQMTFPLSLLSQELSLFHLNEVLYVLSLAYLNCHITPCVLWGHS